MSEKPIEAIWTPGGIVELGEKKLDRVELRAGVGEWFVQFNDFAQAMHVGMHCGLCHKDFTGKNSDNARVFSVACGCREIIWPNRDYRGEPAQRTH